MTVSITNAELQYGVANVSVPSPEKCIIPNYTYRRNNREVLLSVTSGSTATISTDNYQLSTVPSKIYLWVTDNQSSDLTSIITRPQRYATITNITARYGSHPQMLSTLSQEQIYNNICVPAGINIDYQHFKGEAIKWVDSAFTSVSLCSAPVCIIPNESAFSLGAITTPGLAVNENIAFDVQFKNTLGATYSFNLYSLFVYEGFVILNKDSSVEKKQTIFNSVDEVLSLNTVEYSDVREARGGSLFKSI
jgi:hypothetical protein